MIAFSAGLLLLFLYSAPQLFTQGFGALSIKVQDNRLAPHAQDTLFATALERLSQVSGINLYP